MPKNVTFHRENASPNTAVTNATRFRIAEGPNSLAAPNPDTGTDGILTTDLQYNYSGASYIALFETTQKLVLTDDDLTGPMSIVVVVTPVKGDGSLDTANAQTFQVSHTQTLDAWLTQAGVARP